MKRKTLAIPIRCVDFSNSSQVVTFFSRTEGLLEAMAKGAHRAKNAFHGPFDLAVLYEVVALERPAAGLMLVTEAAVAEGFRRLRHSWERHVAASHILEFLRAVAVSGEPLPALFDLVVETFEGLEGATASGAAALLARFDLRALCILGLFAPLVSCLSCERRWSGEDRPVFFSVREGGLLCARCQQRGPVAGGRRLPGGAVRAFNRALEEAPTEAGAVEAWGILAQQEVREVVARLRTNLLERELVLLKSTARWV